MADTNISWATKVWNPIVGCSIISPGCTNCYAMQMAYRLERMGMDRYQGTTKKLSGRAKWTGRLNFVEQTLTQPSRWKKSQRIFVNSMSDLFHEDIPYQWIDRIFGVMSWNKHHTFMILTKRAEIMKNYSLQMSSLSSDQRGRRVARSMGYSVSNDIPANMDWPLPNVMCGVSIERQEYLWRAECLNGTPAAIRFWSLEPLLGEIDLRGHLRHCPESVDLVIIGGESGRNYRPMQIEWLEKIVGQCQSAEINVWVKQDSGLYPGQQGRVPDELWIQKWLD